MPSRRTVPASSSISGLRNNESGLRLLHDLEGLFSERGLLARWMNGGGKRNLYRDVSWIENPTPADFLTAYRRNPIARRALKAFPDSTWADLPSIFETTDEAETAFEKAVGELVANKELRFKKRMLQLDKQACLGEYALLLLGLPGDSSTPAQKGNAGKLAFLRVVGQSNAKISDTEKNASDPRFGQPKMYEINLSGGKDSKSSTPVLFHWTRVVHVAYNCEEGDVFGTPEMLPIINALTSLEYVYAAGAEGYYKTGMGGMGFKVDPNAELGEEDEKTLRRDIRDYMNELRRDLLLQGVEPKPLTMDYKSPKEIVELLIQSICADKGIPMRILLGSEIGDLASTQDRRNWMTIVFNRSRNVVETELLRPIVDRFVELGILPTPAKPYQIEWADPEALSQVEKADYGNKFITALVSYCNSPMALMVSPFSLLTVVFGFKDEVARRLLEEAQDETNQVDGVGRAATAPDTETSPDGEEEDDPDQAGKKKQPKNPASEK